MSVLFADRGHLQPVTEEQAANVERYLHALRDLPPESVDAVQMQLARVMEHYDRTRQIDPLVHFMESLLATARLHRNPNYVRAIAEAMDHAEPEGDGMDREALTSKLEEWRARTKR